MPSIVTHHLFSDEVFTQTEKEIQNKLKEVLPLYHIFAQSFDNLFYYNLLLPKKGKNIRDFATIAQRTNIQDYFKNIILAIKEKKLTENKEVLAYLYGSITHYILDSTCHPFIIFHAGWDNPINKSNQYRGNHEKIEVMIDRIYIKEKRNIELSKANLADTLLPKIKFSKELQEVMNDTYDKTFHQKNMAEIYEKSTKQGHYILKWFVTDKSGIKKQLYKIYDKFSSKNTRMYQNLSFHVKEIDETVLNREHHQWCNPADNSMISKKSFDDLYKDATQKAKEIFHAINQTLQNQMDLYDCLRIIGNNSYATGLEWTRNDTMKYFQN